MCPLEDIVLALAVGLGIALLSVPVIVPLLLPVTSEDCWIMIPGYGDGSELEQKLRSLIWLRDQGFLRGSVAIVNTGLDPRGRELALHLAQRWPEVVVWPVGQLDELFDTCR